MTAWRFLPEGTDELGPGERVLWRGRPQAQGLVRDLFRVRLWLGYFAVLTLWDIAVAFHDGLRANAAFIGLVAPLAAAGLVVGLIQLGAWSIAATTEYIVSDRRIIMRIGVAFPISLSLPLRSIGSADLRLRTGDSGDVCLAFSGEDRLAYLLLWPHARPGKLRVAQPMLRNIRDAQAVAGVLAEALLAVAPDGASSPLVARSTVTATGLDSGGLAGDRLVRPAARRLQGRLA